MYKLPVYLQFLIQNKIRYLLKNLYLNLFHFLSYLKLNILSLNCWGLNIDKTQINVFRSQTKFSVIP